MKPLKKEIVRWCSSNKYKHVRVNNLDLWEWFRFDPALKQARFNAERKGDNTLITIIQAMSTRQTSNPPPGVMDGGQWGTVKYAGDSTNVMCLVLCLIGGFFTCCGTCAFLCPLDKKDAYLLGKKVSTL